MAAGSGSGPARIFLRESALDKARSGITTLKEISGASGLTSETKKAAAVAKAAHDVLTALYPTLRSGPDQLLAGELAAIPGTRGKQQGIRVGEIVAKRLIGIRSSDGSAATPPPQDRPAIVPDRS